MTRDTEFTDLRDQTARLCFIGAGNMASAIIGGLCSRRYPADRLQVCAPDETQLAALRARFGVATSRDNTAFLDHTDVILLCVKPQVMEAACSALAPHLQGRQIAFVSVAAGVSIASLKQWLGSGPPIVRCMPNTPALVQQGATGIYFPADTDEMLKARVKTIFQAIGIVAEVSSEADLHAVTALSGSGPAYFLLFLEALEAAACRMGLAPELARRLAIQTMIGAGCLAATGTDSPATLKKKVRSP